MRFNLRQLDRTILLGVGVALVSALALGAGIFALVSSANDDPAGLPSEGRLEDLVAETGAEGAADSYGQLAEQTPKTGPAPVRLIIPSLLVDAPVASKGITPDNQPEVPERPDLVAWYPFTAYPGQSGNAVFSGHVDWRTRDGLPVAGVFYRLREMKIGQTIEVVLEDGTRLTYRVTGNVAAPYDDPNIPKAMGPTHKDVITLITCGGSWVKDARFELGGNYSHRVLVRAERTQQAAAGG